MWILDLGIWGLDFARTLCQNMSGPFENPPFLGISSIKIPNHCRFGHSVGNGDFGVELGKIVRFWFWDVDIPQLLRVRITGFVNVPVMPQSIGKIVRFWFWDVDTPQLLRV